MSQCLVFRAFFPLSTSWRSHGGRGKRRRSGSRWSKAEDEELTTQKVDCVLLVSPGVLGLGRALRHHVAHQYPSVTRRPALNRRLLGSWTPSYKTQRGHLGVTADSSELGPYFRNFLPSGALVPVRAEDQDRVQSN